MNKIRFFSFFLVLALLVSLYHALPEKFRIHADKKATSWELSPLSAQEKENIDKILTEPFSFLGSGGQCYAFVSKDEKYVLKFFKQKANPCPLFNSCKIAYETLKEETGMLALHLNA